MQITKLLDKFINSEKSGGILLIACTVVSLTIANGQYGDNYIQFWQLKLGGLTLEHWINDGLMTLFFLLIGLELEREIYRGELSKFRDAMLPVFAAVGGMVVPAGIYFLINQGTVTQRGVGIPMATDIAFALGVLLLVGRRVPSSLKVFLTALAVIDDLGAILVIAFFYSDHLQWGYLLAALLVFGFLYIMGRWFKVYSMLFYLLGGIAMWVLMLNSGVHATITGVLLAFALPFGGENQNSLSYRLQSSMHQPVAFIILPIFALANTAIRLDSKLADIILQPYSLGIAGGLLIGKPLGIFLFSKLAVFTKLAALPKALRWKHIVGVGFIAGIGFTMSIFITLLAFSDAVIINNAKLIILLSSLTAAVIGFLLLKFFLGTSQQKRPHK